MPPPSPATGLLLHLRRLAAPGRELLRDLSLHVPAGVVHTLMGPSGCGKSTLLHVLCATADYSIRFEGTVHLDGQCIDPLNTRQRRIGILFQDDLLFPHMTVLQNLLFALPGENPTQRTATALQALAEVDLQHHAHADPTTLSGGQRARVALVRALLARPRALLLDEPYNRLDAPLRERMRLLVREFVARQGIPALLVSHDPQDIADPAHLTRLT